MSATLNGIPFDETAWTTPTHADGNYTAVGGGTWTVTSGDVILCKYKQIGRLLFFKLSVDTSSIAGTVNILLVNISAMTGKTLVSHGANFVGLQDAGGGFEVIFGNNNTTSAAFVTSTGAAFATGTNSRYIGFTTVFEIV